MVSQALDNHFEGKSEEPFTYEDFENTRSKLVRAILDSLTEKDKEFLLSIKSAEPDWSIYDFERFPAVQWKLQNLRWLKDSNPVKHEEQLELLKGRLIE